MVSSSPSGAQVKRLHYICTAQLTRFFSLFSSYIAVFLWVACCNATTTTGRVTSSFFICLLTWLTLLQKKRNLVYFYSISLSLFVCIIFVFVLFLVSLTYHHACFHAFVLVHYFHHFYIFFFQISESEQGEFS